MAKDDCYDAGEQIKKLVQDAVDGKDFSQLSSMITSVVNDAVDSVQAAMQDNIYQHTNREAADRIRRNMQEKQEKARAAEKEKAVVPVKTKLRVPGEISGNVMKWTGFSVSGMLGFSLVILAASAAALGFSIAVPGSILAVLFAGRSRGGRRPPRRCRGPGGQSWWTGRRTAAPPPSWGPGRTPPLFPAAAAPPAGPSASSGPPPGWTRSTSRSWPPATPGR